MTESNMNAILSLRETLPGLLGEHLRTLDEQNGVLFATINPASLLSVLTLLRDTNELAFDMLVDIAGVDTLGLKLPDRFQVIYLLKSTKRGYRLALRCCLPAEAPQLASVSQMYPVADWLEREVWDLFGIQFSRHPNLKRLLNPQSFVGHPLRKDYPLEQRQAIPESETLLDEMEVKLKKIGRTLEGVTITDYEHKPPAEFTQDDDQLMLVNLGPAHPIMHGILRLLAALEGETIVAAVPEIGFLHRGAEKSMENGTYTQAIPYTDRLNYASPAMNNIGYCKAVEKMLGITLPERDILMRVILCELGRIMDHLLCTGPHLVDLGALTPFWYLFQMREKIYDVMEKYSGARLTFSCARIGAMPLEIYPGFAGEVEKLLTELPRAIDDIRRLVERNRIFYDRCYNIGAISQTEAIGFGMTGPCLRATGFEYDLRKAEPYYMYDQFDFSVCVGTNGDTYDRFFVRIYEMIESAKIIRQALDRLKKAPAPEAGAKKRAAKVAPPAGEIYDCTEAANGELGFYIISDGSGKPYRIKIRAPSLCNYSCIERLSSGIMIADLVSIVGSINVVGGEIDR